ncbi:MAG: hypothetical protein V1850_02470 [Candidatus Bathyarchaeota archaeon]
MSTEHLSEHLPLSVWSEVVGAFGGLSRDRAFTYVKIDGWLLTFHNESDEAIYVQERLDDNIIGRKIAILRTDILEKPILVRLV